MELSRLELRERGISPFVAECLSNKIPRRPMNSLDAPCGYGRHSLYLCGLGSDVTSVDIDENRLISFIADSKFDVKLSKVAHDLNIYRDEWSNKFDLLLIIDFWSKYLTGYAKNYIKKGGHLIIETMGNRGGNWIELPKPGETLEALGDGFKIIASKIKLAGPSKIEAETAKVLAKRI